MNILITRPEEEAKELQQLILNNTNYNALLFPVLKIIPLAKKNIPKATIVIFISHNAVKNSKYLFNKINFDKTKIAAIGIKTKKELQKNNINVDISPKNEFSTEGLLKEMNGIDFNQEDILIVRGKGGREKLRNKLINKGAKVNYLEVYERTPMELKNEYKENLCSFLTSNSGIIIITSIDVLTFFANMIKKLDIPINNLTKYKILTLSNRIKNKAYSIGFHNVEVISNINSFFKTNN